MVVMQPFSTVSYFCIWLLLAEGRGAWIISGDEARVDRVRQNKRT